MTQLNAIFDRNVPFGLGPFSRLRSRLDQQLDAPEFQQSGVRLILETLRAAPEPVDIAVFCSSRALAVAFNREPELLREKVRRVHLNAGSSSETYLEWNVWLDPLAFERLFESGLPLALYPCASADGPFVPGEHNTAWSLPNLGFVHDLHPKIRRYLAFALARSQRMDFLGSLEEDPPELVWRSVLARRHFVWETAVWTQISQRRLVRRADGRHRLIPKADVLETDHIFKETLQPCTLELLGGGRFRWAFTDAPATVSMYHREHPLECELALREALPALYASFLTEHA